MKRNLIIFASLAAMICNPAMAGYDEGLASAKAGNFAQAINEWKPLAEKGNANAQRVVFWFPDSPNHVFRSIAPHSNP